MNDFDQWTQAEGPTLARSVYTDLPDAFALPSTVDRQKTIQDDDGPRNLAEELYEVLRELDIAYVLAPYNPSAGTSQRLRTPALILRERRATCIDLVLLFAGMCLANDLLPLVVIVEGHAFVGVRGDKNRNDNPVPPIENAFNEQGMLTDLEKLRELSEYYIWIEATGCARAEGTMPDTFPEGRGRGGRGQMTFRRACQAGSEQVDTSLRSRDDMPSAGTRVFRFALDIYDLQVNKGVIPTESGRVEATRTVIQGNQTTIGGNVNGPVFSGNFTGPVNVGPSRTVNTSGGDYTEGDRITVGDISNSSGIAVGRGAQASVTTTYNTNDDVGRVFGGIYTRIQRSGEPESIKQLTSQQMRAIEAEVRKGSQANPQNVESSLQIIHKMAPEIFGLTIDGLTNSLPGVDPNVRAVAERMRF